MLWRHSHEIHSNAHGSEQHRTHAVGAMILWGDAFHNASTGLVAAAYLTTPGSAS